MRLVSIDPGISGALALLEQLEGPLPMVREVHDMPIMPRKKDGSGHQVSPAALSHLLKSLRPEIVVIEQISGVGAAGEQRMGNSGALNYGIGFGVVWGCCAGYATIFVLPRAWKKRQGIPAKKAEPGSGNHNDYARTRALQLFPYMAGELKLKKHVGRAEAILIGLDYLSSAKDAPAQLVQPVALGQVLAVDVPSGYTLDLAL